MATRGQKTSRAKGRGKRRSSPASAAVVPDPRDAEFTARQLRFIDELLADPEMNGTRAALKAYPAMSHNSARVQAQDNLKLPHIAAEIDRRKAPAALKGRMSIERTEATIGDGLSWDPLDAFNADGTVKAIWDMPPEVRRQIAGMDVEEIREDGVLVGRVKKLRFVDRTKYVDFAGRRHKMFVDKVEIVGAAGRADRLQRARERTRDR